MSVLDREAPTSVMEQFDLSILWVKNPKLLVVVLRLSDNYWKSLFAHRSVIRVVSQNSIAVHSGEDHEGLVGSDSC